TGKIDNNKPPDDHPGDTGTTKHAGERDRIIQRVLKSTVWVVDLNQKGQPISWGSGSLIDRTNGLILTNYHVVHDSPNNMAILFPDYDPQGKVIAERKHYAERGTKKQYIRGTAVATDEQRDLALIQLAAPAPSDVRGIHFADKEPGQGDN